MREFDDTYIRLDTESQRDRQKNWNQYRAVSMMARGIIKYGVIFRSLGAYSICSLPVCSQHVLRRRKRVKVENNTEMWRCIKY